MTADRQTDSEGEESSAFLEGMLPGFAGLLVVGPIIGHASWHAYRAAIGT